ncbi:pleckstrin homology domain-containing family G member 5-like [Pomacea canaliculata]|uniref:pleckstrin homology domain-containing family G member 5-like n=1 Tax=Pomacea canaliculata TaxID=400727 RepID=UPI000D734A04|nr:pleckstrin homology domain-containing family G member 5-like [Pomacea canaliculata]
MLVDNMDTSRWRYSLPLERSSLTSSVFYVGETQDREKHEQLHEILCGYSSNGLPPMPELLSLGRPKFDESLFQTEAHWSSVVDNASTLTKRQHDQQEAIWELLQTELSYISVSNCLLNIQQEALLNEIETERLFSNIDQVLICNCRLWQDSLINILEDARRNRHPLNPSLLKPAFLSEFKKLIGPYTKYCMEQKQCTEYMKSRHTENDLFKMFVLWAETQKQCNRLKLTDLLVKPVQRITKYSLLLQAILRKTEDDRQRRDLLEMIASVDECVISINSKMQYQLDMERLEAIMTKIEPYDCVEPPSEECVKIIQEYNSKFNLMTPMAGLQVPQTRSLLMHSNLRLKESQSKTDVDCFLFTDLILVCKSNKRMDKYKIFRPPMRLDQIVVSDLKDRGSFLLIYMNEYDVPVAAYTFHGDQTAVRLWLEKIRDAQAEYNERKMEDHRLHVSRLSRSREEAKNNSSPGTTPLNMKYHPVADLPSIPRSASMDSTEGQFLPNILPAKTSDGSLPSNGILSPQALERVSSCSEISSRGASRTHVLSQERHASSSPEYSPTNERKHKPVKASQSVPNIHGSQLMQAGTEDCYDEEGDNRGMTVDDMSVITSVGSLSLSPSCLMEQSSFDSDFNSCLNKPNQRRVSRSEKRYYTADSIQELRQEKDNSIHKRLSWQNENQLEERLRRKVLSSDSVHSMPSSSGVSSAGSLHLNPESDISEETESQKTGRSLSSVDSSLETDTNNSVANSDPESSRCRAKSSSDIAELISSLKTGEREDGISSVNLPVHGHSKRFSHSQLLIMKKHLLLDASVEASEV